MKIRPIHARVLVKRDGPEGKTKGGIYIPDTAQQKLTRGEVIAVGPGRRLESGRVVEPEVKPGDKIVFGKYSGCDFQDDSEDRLFMNEDEILGVIEED